MGQRRPTLASAALALVAALGCGCYPSGGRGSVPLDDQIYFPVAVALTPKSLVTGKSNWLMLANSDFDLKYNSGTIQALALGDASSGVEQAVRLCEAEMRSSDCLADPGTPERLRCKDKLDNLLLCSGPTQPDGWSVPFVKASVRIGAFASDMKVVPLFEEPSAGTTKGQKPVDGISRVLAPVRGDATLTYVDAVESADGQHIKLDCYAGAGNDEFGHDCDANHRVGQVVTADARQLTLEGEPFALATPDYWSCEALDAAGGCALEPAHSSGIASVVHQVSGDVSVFRNTQRLGGSPVLSYTLGSLAVGATAIAPLDLSDGVDTTSSPIVPFVPRFLVANRSQSSLFLVSYLGDDGNPDRSVLSASSLIPITTQTTGYDTRGVVVDPPGQGEGARPIRVFLASRSPASIVIGQIDRESGVLHFYDNVPLPIGPSRITRRSFVDDKGIAHTRIYVASYDSAYVIAYDPETRRLSDVIKAGRGPYSITIDETRQLAFVANFIDGTVQVIDVNPITTIPDPSDPAKTTKVPNILYEQVVYTIGKPRGPQS